MCISSNIHTYTPAHKPNYIICACVHQQEPTYVHTCTYSKLINIVSKEIH